MNRKKILYLILVVVMFSFTLDVFAGPVINDQGLGEQLPEKITCDYGEYKLVYTPKKYTTIKDYTTPYSYLKVYDSNDKNIGYTFYPEGDQNKEYDIILSNNATLFRSQPMSESECPSILTYQNPKSQDIFAIKLGGDTTHKYGDDEEQKNESKFGKVTCGNITDIPKKIPELTSMAINLIQVAIPVILVLMGSMDLLKGITSQKEDEIKKGQQVFVKRLIVAALIFFVVVIVKLIISIVAQASSDNISDCIDCFISNDC